MSATDSRENPDSTLHARNRRLRYIGWTVWPLLTLFWLLGLFWMGMSSLICWGGALSEGELQICNWAFAPPLVVGLSVILASVLALAELRKCGRALGHERHRWRDHIRFGYRAAPDDDRLRVRRAFFGALTAVGWTLAALAFSYLQLRLLALLLGAGVTTLALVINRGWLQDYRRPRYSFGIGVPPHERWPVAWYSPGVLLPLARNWLSSFDMLRNADPRDAFVDRLRVTDLTQEPGDELWVDFIADCGDGGNATYTVARAALADQCLGMPRGRLLVLGGDLAYPGAGAKEYRSRLFELFEGARQHSRPEREQRTVLAIPQNHDWFDSASTFKRHFVNRDLGEFIGAATPQQTTYFAARLKHGWWILGLDFALGGDIDRGQFEGFRALLPGCGPEPFYPGVCMQPGDQVILVYPEPYWVRRLGDDAPPAHPHRYQRLEAAINAAGCTVRLRLAGDLHHYVRELHDTDVEGRTALVICGCGGAFLHPTHTAATAAPRRFDAKPQASALTSEMRQAMRVGTVPRPTVDAEPDRRVYPDPAVTRQLAWGNLFALFKPASNRWGGPGLWKGNLQFALVIGALYWLAQYVNALLFSASFAADGFVDAAAVPAKSYCALLWDWGRAVIYSPPTAGVYGALFLLCLSLAKDEKNGVVRWVFPFLHFALHVCAAAWLFWLSAAWAENAWQLTMQDRCEGACKAVVTALTRGVLVFVCGALLGGLITGAYLALMARGGWLVNNAFSPLAHEDYKGFLRMCVASDGTLEAYFLACDRVPRRWTTAVAPDGEPAGSARPAWSEAEDEPPAQWRVADCFKLHRKRPARPEDGAEKRQST